MQPGPGSMQAGLCGAGWDAWKGPRGLAGEQFHGRRTGSHGGGCDAGGTLRVMGSVVCPPPSSYVGVLGPNAWNVALEKRSL